MRNVKGLSIVALTLLIFYLFSPNVSMVADALEKNNASKSETGKIEVLILNYDDDSITWEVIRNDDFNNGETETVLQFSDNMTHHHIETVDGIEITQTDDGYILKTEADTSTYSIELTTKRNDDTASVYKLSAFATIETDQEEAFAIFSLDDLHSDANDESESPEENVTEKSDIEKTNDVPVQKEEKNNPIEQIEIIEEADGLDANMGTLNLPRTTNSGLQMEYDATSYSKDVRNYNGIIFGNHYVNSGDNEGATAVKGNVIQEGGFDYGAADSGNPNLIGTQPLPRDTPGLLLAGKVVGNSTIGYFNGAVLSENGDPNNVLQARSGHKVFVSQAELDQVFADFRAYIDQHEQNLIPFVTSNPSSSIEFYTSTLSDKVLVANVAGNHFSLGSIDFPNLDQFDKVIILSNAQTVNFSNGSIFYQGVQINTSWPAHMAPGFEDVATKLTWLFPNATTIQSNGYGVIGTIVAPDANYIGNGGSLNGQLFINDLRSYGGFELHQIRNKVEDPFYGQIKITKVDSQNSALKLPGAKFNIVDADGEIVGELVTNANGEAISEDLPVGDYSLVETQAPEGYEQSNQTIAVTVEKDTVTEVTITNGKTPIPTGKIVIIKVDEDDNTMRLPGAKFHLFDADENFVMELVTDSNGEADTGQLPVGNYTLVEVEAPENYELLTEPIPIFTVRNGSVEKTIQNKRIPDPLGEIKIIKVDADDHSTLLEDAEFQLFDENNNLVATVSTDRLGEIIFSDLTLGHYTLKETKAPEGYRLLTAEIGIELTKENPNVTRVIENTSVGWTIPETGGIGTLLFYGVGLILMTVALWFVVRKRKA